MVILALEERDIDIETGYGVEGFLPDWRVGSIIESVLPMLSARLLGGSASAERRFGGGSLR